jgi:hypothetical protein
VSGETCRARLETRVCRGRSVARMASVLGMDRDAPVGGRRLSGTDSLRSASLGCAYALTAAVPPVARLRGQMVGGLADGRIRSADPRPVACLWLAKGVDPVTVQAWLGHASTATTNIYPHHLGSSADRAGLERLNTLAGRGGQSERNAEGQSEKPASRAASADETGFSGWWS